VAAVDREEWVTQPATSAGRKADKQYLQLPPYVNPFRALMDLVAKLGEDKSILIVFPDSKSIERFALLRPDAIILDSSLERSTRYRNFLRAKYSVKSLVIGSRSAIFADIPDLDTVIIFDEGSEHLYEQRSPGWNARDVGLIRADLEGVHFIAIGYSPSANLARMIEDGGMRFRSTTSRVSVDSFQQEFQELLPGRIIPAIRSALLVGPVLVLATRKGYSQAISCSKCRNIALCSCGARLFQRSATSIIECSLCENTFSDWSCSWCNGKVPYLLSRGTTRFAHEIGKALPGVKVVLSEGDSPLSDTKSFEGIVIATPGSAPYLSDGYAAVVVLDADKLLTQSDLKAQERAEQLIFSQTGFLRKDGKVLLVIAHSHPIVGALSAWKPSLLSQKQLADRKDVLLPPFAKSVSIDVSSTEASLLIRGLEAAKSDGRLSASTRILGPIQLKADLQRILLLAPLDESQLLVSLIHEYQRRRSASKKTLLAMRIDPYSLTK
jgi:primosomal protein N' (replication factor Y)